MIPGDKGLSVVNQELTGVNQVNQGLPVLPNVYQDKQVLPVSSDTHKIIGDQVVIPGEGTGLDKRKKRFDWQRKRRFLRIAKTYWPNVTLCCAMAGIHPSSYYLHLKQDPIFYAKVKQIDQGTTDRIEGVMASEAINPKSFLDRMAYLRAHRPELYNPAKVVKIEGYKMTQSERGERLAGLEGAIDAQIVSAYQTRKERLQAQREKRGELPPGDTGVRGE
jgi:hypothetical protein